MQSRNNDISLEKTLATSDAYDERKMEFASDKTHPNLHETNSTTCFKLVQINHLSIYWNPISRTLPEICTLPYIGRPFKDVQSLMSRTVANRTHQSIDRPHHHYLLYPVDINSIIDVSFNPTTGVTKVCSSKFVVFSLILMHYILQCLNKIGESEAISAGHFNSNRRQAIP